MSPYFSYARQALPLVFFLSSAVCFSGATSHTYWFVSAGAGFSQNSDLTDTNSSERHPPALFGQGYKAEGEHDNIRSFGAGFGYRINPLLSIELAYDYQSMTFNGNANFKNAGRSQPTSSDLFADSLLLSGKVDLLGLFADTRQKLRPFVAVSGGVTQITAKNVHFSFPALQRSPTTPAITIAQGGTNRHGVFRASTGVDWLINDSTGFSLSYQYYNLGKFKTDKGTAYVYGHGCNKAGEPLGCNLYVGGLEADVRTNLFSVNFWRRF